MAPSTRQAASSGKRKAADPGKGKKKKNKSKNGPKLPTQPKKAVEKAKDPPKEDKNEKKKRPPNFVEEEDIILCRAIVNISQDSATGTDQTIENFTGKELLQFSKS